MAKYEQGKGKEEFSFMPGQFSLAAPQSVLHYSRTSSINKWNILDCLATNKWTIFSLNLIEYTENT